MIKVDELLYEFELRINQLDREDNQNIFLENKLIHLNNAQITWVKSKLNPNNIYRIGYEGMRKRIDDLQILKVNGKKLSLVQGTNKKYLNYEGNLNIDDYMFYDSAYAEVRRDSCSTTLGINLIKEGQLDTLYYNENYCPSFFWRETIGTIGNNKLYVYTDDTFIVENIYLTYLRRPKKIDKEGYIRLDGSNSVNQDCELPEYAKNDILDIAVGYAAMATDNQIQAQFAKLRERDNE